MLDPAAPLATANPPAGVAATVTVVEESDCAETEAGETASVIPSACVTCKATFWVAVNPSPVAVTVIVDEAIAAVDAAVRVSVSAFEPAVAEGVSVFADQAAVTPPGSPLTLQPMLPANDPPVAAVRLTVPDPPWARAAEVEAAVRVSVGGKVTVSA